MYIRLGFIVFVIDNVVHENKGYFGIQAPKI